MMKNKVKIKKWIKNNKALILVAILLFLFPLIVGMFYALPIPQIIAVSSGDLLAYYGTAFGILGSFFTYRLEKRKAKKERQKELKPIFSVNVTRDKEKLDLFEIKIIKHSEQELFYVHLYDEFIDETAKERRSFKVTYNQTISNAKSIDFDYNITMDDKILDSDGYPKYVQILCEDTDGNSWNCCYYKIKDCDSIYYYPREIEII